MASHEQTRANRKNAQRSTGPRTPAGKAQASQNALKHGLRAHATVLPGEDLDEFQLLVAELENQFQPQTAVEWNLLRQLADAEWRMRRVPCLEAALLAARLHETVRYYSLEPERLPEDGAEADMVLLGEAAESDAGGGDTLSKLSRYESRLSHRYFKALDQLQKLKNLQQRDAQAEATRPQPAPDGGGGHVAAGDPGPVRKGGAEGECAAPASPQPPPAAAGDARLNAPSGPKPTVNKRDSDPGCRPRPNRAKRTQLQRSRPDAAPCGTRRITAPAGLRKGACPRMPKPAEAG